MVVYIIMDIWICEPTTHEWTSSRRRVHPAMRDAYSEYKERPHYYREKPYRNSEYIVYRPDNDPYLPTYIVRIADDIPVSNDGNEIITQMIGDNVRVFTEAGNIVPCPIKCLMANIHDIKYNLLENKDFKDGKGTMVGNFGEGFVNSLIQKINSTETSKENYELFIGKWGYVDYCSNELINEKTEILVIELDKGYSDNFEFDLGWSSTGTATTGKWERGKPIATDSGSQIGVDDDWDCGNNAYLTGNSFTINSDYDDVDKGTAILVSPQMDLTSYSNPHINFSRGFYCYFGPQNIDDSLKIYLSNGKYINSY